MSVETKSNPNGEYKVQEDDEFFEAPLNHSNMVDMEDDQSDEDFSEPLFDEGGWSYTADNRMEIYSQDTCVEVQSSTQFDNDILEKKHEFVCVSYDYTITLLEDRSGNDQPHSWSSPEPSLFQIRGETYLQDHKKITAKGTLLQTVAIDFLKSNKREDHLASQPWNIVQKYAAHGRPEFFFVINFQVPGATTYSLASYHMMRTPIKEIPLLERFLEGDDAFRNSRFKIIPHLPKGPWMLRHTFRRPTVLGRKVQINYIRGKNYLEMDINVGSSAIARQVAGKTFSIFSNIIIDIGVVIQANTREELPEQLLGAYRLSHLDLSKAILAHP